MNKNVGASFTLSVLVVVFFAVALYQPEKRRHHQSALDETTQISKEGKSLSGPKSAHLIEAASKPAIGLQGKGRNDSKPPLDVVPTVARKPSGNSIDPPTSTRRGPFTTVLEGETLAGVAARVYGPKGDPNTLWVANRDLIDEKDGPLPTGMTLRTP